MAEIGGIDLTGGTIAAFGTLLVYDVFFVTFEDEVNLVWPSRWTYTKVLFFLNRYLPFVDTFLSLHLLLGTNNTDRECLLGFRAVTWLIVIGIMISELILMIRTYALWGGSPASRIVLGILAADIVAVYIPAIVITQLEVNSLAYKASSPGCIKTKNSSPIIFIAFLLLIVSETVIVSLTLIRAWKHHRQTQSALLVRMYKDGLLYYLYLLAFALVNLLIAVAAPPQFANWLTTPQRVLHSILTSRVLIHIRAHALSPDTHVTHTRADLSFVPGVVSGSGAAAKGQGDSGGTSTGTWSGSGSGTRSATTSSGSGGGVGGGAVLTFRSLSPDEERDLESAGGHGLGARSAATGSGSYKHMEIELEERDGMGMEKRRSREGERETLGSPPESPTLHSPSSAGSRSQSMTMSPRARSKSRAESLGELDASADLHKRRKSSGGKGKRSIASAATMGAAPSLGESSRST